MANKDCPDCNDWGGNWPSRPPYNGGPWPTRTLGTGRNQGVCNRFALSFTQEEKDMRRKAEVLQHRRNQTNLTKNQQWAYAVRHRSTNPARGAQLAKEAKNCPKIIYSSSHASDVPGPDTTLYLDPDIPVVPLQSGLQQSTVGGENEPILQIQCDGTPGIVPDHGGGYPPFPPGPKPGPPGPTPGPNPQPSVASSCLLLYVAQQRWNNWCDDLKTYINGNHPTAFSSITPAMIPNGNAIDWYTETLKKMLGFIESDAWGRLGIKTNYRTKAPNSLTSGSEINVTWQSTDPLVPPGPNFPVPPGDIVIQVKVAGLATDSYATAPQGFGNGDIGNAQPITLCTIDHMQSALEKWWGFDSSNHKFSATDAFCCGGPTTYVPVCRIRGIEPLFPLGFQVGNFHPENYPGFIDHYGNDKLKLQWVQNAGQPGAVPYTRFPFRRDDITGMEQYFGWKQADITYAKDTQFHGGVNEPDNQGLWYWLDAYRPASSGLYLNASCLTDPINVSGNIGTICNRKPAPQPFPSLPTCKAYVTAWDDYADALFPFLYNNGTMDFFKQLQPGDGRAWKHDIPGWLSQLLKDMLFFVSEDFYKYLTTSSTGQSTTTSPFTRGATTGDFNADPTSVANCILQLSDIVHDAYLQTDLANVRAWSSPFSTSLPGNADALKKNPKLPAEIYVIAAHDDILFSSSGTKLPDFAPLTSPSERIDPSSARNTTFKNWFALDENQECISIMKASYVIDYILEYFGMTGIAGSPVWCEGIVDRFDSDTVVSCNGKNYIPVIRTAGVTNFIQKRYNFAGMMHVNPAYFPDLGYAGIAGVAQTYITQTSVVTDPTTLRYMPAFPAYQNYAPFINFFQGDLINDTGGYSWLDIPTQGQVGTIGGKLTNSIGKFPFTGAKTAARWK